MNWLASNRCARILLLSAAISLAQLDLAHAANEFDTHPSVPGARLPDKPHQDLSQGHAAVFDSIVASGRGAGQNSNGALPGPFNIWFYLPEDVAEAHDRLGQAQRFATASLSNRLKEVAILTVGAHFRCSVEVWAHAAVARKTGLSEEVISALSERRAPLFGNDSDGRAQKVVHAFVSELLATNRVSDESYARALEAVGGTNEAMAELAGSVGHYAGLAMQMNMFRIPAPGKKQAFDYYDVKEKEL